MHSASHFSKSDQSICYSMQHDFFVKWKGNEKKSNWSTRAEWLDAKPNTQNKQCKEYMKISWENWNAYLWTELKSSLAFILVWFFTISN